MNTFTFSEFFSIIDKKDKKSRLAADIFIHIEYKSTAEQEDIMRAVVAVIGKDTVGILAKVSGICAEHNANVMDVTQTIMQDLFAMTMMIEISKLNIDYIDFADKLTKAGSEMGLQVHVMHEDIFNAMHTI